MSDSTDRQVIALAQKFAARAGWDRIRKEHVQRAEAELKQTLKVGR